MGCLINPDPGEASGIRDPGAGRSLLVSALRKTGRAGCTGPCPLRGLPLGPAALFAAFHQRGKHCRGVVVEFERVQGFSDAEDSALAWRRCDSSALGSLRSQFPAYSRRHSLLRAHAQYLLRYGVVFERLARAADQDGGSGSMLVWYGAAGRRNRQGSAHRKMAGRDPLFDRGLRLAKRRRQEADLRRQRQEDCSSSTCEPS